VIDIHAVINVHFHGLKCEDKQQLNRIEQSVQGNTNLLDQLSRQIMATGQQLQQNLDDITGLAQQLIDYVVGRDAEVNKLKQDLADAVQRANIADADKAAIQADMDAAFTKNEDAENNLRAKIAGLPPVGGTPLALTYADRASFDSAVAAYTGPERVTLDGVDVKAGSDPSVDYFTHSADGHIDRTGPTD